MHTLLLLLLVLVPAPKAEPPKPNPIVGAWAIQWGFTEQTTFFYHDGTCDSPEYGGGLWSVDDEGYIWFGERDNAAQYVMHFDAAAGEGSGWRVDSTGQITGRVDVRIRRGERLPMPREVE